jgi:hypothetical protein
LRSRNAHCPHSNRKPLWELDWPAALGSIHAQQNLGVGRRVLGGVIEDEKIGAELRDGQGKVIQDQMHPHVGGMTAGAACYAA